MGDIARRWNEMSDLEKLQELRDPTITRTRNLVLRDLVSVGNDDDDDDDKPIGNCARARESECGLKDRAECAVHAPPTSGGKSRKSKSRSKSREKARVSAKFHKAFGDLVVTIRRAAMDLDTLEQRAELVDRYWRRLKRQFERSGIPPDFAAVVRQCLYSETISWPWYGMRETYPPGEGE
jgi:hypothetical protein